MPARMTEREREARFLRGDSELVSNLMLRELFMRRRARGELSAQSVAASMGWTRTKDGGIAPDGSRVTRTLGVTFQRSRGKSYLRQYVGYETACRLCAALEASPVDVGL